MQIYHSQLFVSSTHHHGQQTYKQLQQINATTTIWRRVPMFLHVLVLHCCDLPMCFYAMPTLVLLWEWVNGVGDTAEDEEPAPLCSWYSRAGHWWTQQYMEIKIQIVLEIQIWIKIQMQRLCSWYTHAAQTGHWWTHQYMEIQIQIHIWKYKYKYNTKSRYNNKNLPHWTSDTLILPRLTLVDRALKDYKLLQIWLQISLQIQIC